MAYEGSMDYIAEPEVEEMTQPMTVKFELGGQLFSAISHPTKRWKISLMDDEQQQEQHV